MYFDDQDSGKINVDHHLKFVLTKSQREKIYSNAHSNDPYKVKRACKFMNIMTPKLLFNIMRILGLNKRRNCHIKLRINVLESLYAGHEELAIIAAIIHTSHGLMKVSDHNYVMYDKNCTVYKLNISNNFIRGIPNDFRTIYYHTDTDTYSCIADIDSERYSLMFHDKKFDEYIEDSEDDTQNPGIITCYTFSRSMGNAAIISEWKNIDIESEYKNISGGRYQKDGKVYETLTEGYMIFKTSKYFEIVCHNYIVRGYHDKGYPIYYMMFVNAKLEEIKHKGSDENLPDIDFRYEDADKMLMSMITGDK